MATDGTPEFAAKRCGEAIARLRTLRDWSRTQLLLRLYNELSPADPAYHSLSETWLARLENGRMVKVPRSVVEALCRALRCTPQERARVLLYADRNVLVNEDAEPSPAAETLTYAMDRLYHDAHDVLAALLQQRLPSMLDEMELLEVTEAALRALIARHQQRQCDEQRPPRGLERGNERGAAHSMPQGMARASGRRG